MKFACFSTSNEVIKLAKEFVVLPQFNAFEEQQPEAKLRFLGLTKANLDPAIRAYADALARSGPYHPPGHAGITAYGDAIAALSEELIPLGWKPRIVSGWCSITSPEGVSIFVMSGDSGTGVDELTPSSRYDRGPVTKKVVQENAVSIGYCDTPQLRLSFSPNEQSLKRRRPRDGYWCLMFNEARGELKVELSFPVAFNEAGFVCYWGDRICLGTESRMPDFEVTTSPRVDFDIDEELGE